MNLDEQLVDACKRGDSTEVEKLVKLGASIEGEDCYPMTPLTVASGCGHAKIVEYLLDQGAQVDARDKWHGAGWGGHRTPLMFALTGGHIDVTKILVERGADIMASDGGLGAAAVFWAVCSGKIETVEFMVKRGASLLVKDRQGQTLLFWAIGLAGCYYRGAPSIAEPGGSNIQLIHYLLKNGVDLSWRSSSGDTVLFLAAGSHDTELVKQLLQAGCDVNACNDWGWTPLFWAAVTQNNVEILEVFLKSGAEVNHKAKDGTTALFWAKEEGYEDAVELLLKYGADPPVVRIVNRIKSTCSEHPVVDRIARTVSQYRA